MRHKVPLVYRDLDLIFLSPKKVLQVFFRLYEFVKKLFIYGGYLPALWGPSLNLTVCFILNISLDFRILLISFLLPLIVYSHDYHEDLESDAKTNPERANFLDKKRSKQLTLIYLTTMGILLVWVFNFAIIVFVIALFVMGILYTGVLKGITKKITAFKNFYIALIWGSWGTFLIAIYHKSSINLSFIFLFLFIYAKVIVNTIFFDLKDTKSDKKSGLKTMPAVLGIKNTINFLKGINILTSSILIIGVYLKVLPPIALFLTLFYAYTSHYLKVGQVNPAELSSKSFIADIEAILYPGILVLMKFIFGG
jgi:4-hydroxybenzoate polyprenyltransferase